MDGERIQHDTLDKEITHVPGPRWDRAAEKISSHYSEEVAI